MTYTMHGGDHGNYQITTETHVKPVAHVRRNQTGGGYTAHRVSDGESVSFRHMPKADTAEKQADAVMAMFD